VLVSGEAVRPAARTVEAPKATAVGDVTVLLVGMHRSGTSAITGLMGHLGLAVPSGDDLMARSRPANERGHWESLSLVDFNNRLLNHLDGSWSAPPHLEPGWEDGPSLETWRREARSLFDTTFPSRPLVWKDPRTCVLLPFWRTVLDPPLVAVFVMRDPMEVARSLQARNHMPFTYGLAIWERYLRRASADLHGIPTFATEYSESLSDPEAWCGRLVDFLGRCGVQVPASTTHDAVGFLDADLRHHQSEPEAGADMPASTLEVWERLRAGSGEHLPWHAPDLSPEPRWVDDVLVLARRAEMARERVRSLQRSRAYRFAQSVTRWRDRALRR
jgi:hypothetical protein